MADEPVTPDGGEPDEGEQPGRTFTQADLDKIVEQRLSRERAKYADYDELKKRVTEAEDKDKTELQKLADAKTLAERRAAEAESASLRMEVALDKAPEGMSVAQVRKLAKRLAGATREELEADAEELFADFAPGGDDDDKSSAPPSKPVTKLPGGKNPTAEPPETDPLKIAAQVRRLNA